MIGLRRYSYNSLLQLYLCCCLVTYSCLSSAQDDAAILLKVKEQLGNPSGLSSWVPGTDFCKWRYIYCSSVHRVRSIRIESLDVSAPVPSAFSDLIEMETLSMQKMPGLFGQIPDSFGKLSHLKIFNIIGTSVTGPIPDSLSRTSLTSVALFNNKLTGSIPKSLSKLPNLQWLDLSNNSLTGFIPSHLVRGSPEEPAGLKLHHNNLIGKIPTYYGRPYFWTLSFGHNRLTGDPSFLLSKNSMLGDIDLSWNKFNFDLTNVELPDTLRFLYLSHNNIKGKVPVSLIDVLVAVLDLSYNKLCGEIPTGGYMSLHHAKDYEHNKCLCGTPLPPCTKGSSPPPVPPSSPPPVPPSFPPSIPPSNPPIAPHSVPPSIPPYVPPSVPSYVPPVSPPSVPSFTPPSYPPTVPPSLPPPFRNI